MKSFRNLLLIAIMVFASISATFAVGAVADGEWVADGADWKYVVNGQPVVNDWVFIKEGDDYAYYYLDAAGHMSTGIVKIGEEYYSFEKNGHASKKGTKINSGDNSFKVANKGLIEDFIDSDYTEYLKNKENEAAEKAAEKAFQENFKAENERIKASIKASEEAYKKEHAAEIAASEAAKQAEEALKKESQAKANAEAAAKAEMLMSSANREKLIAEANKANSRKSAIRNLVVETRKQLNEKRSQLISQAKSEVAANPVNNQIDRLVDLYNESVDEYASFLDGMINTLSAKYKMRDESIEDAVDELTTVLSEAKEKFATDFDKIGEDKTK